MPIRLKKIIGALFIFVFLIFWIVTAVSLSGFIPENKLAELAFYAIAGLGWGIPLLPLLKWMEQTKTRTRH